MVKGFTLSTVRLMRLVANERFSGNLLPSAPIECLMELVNVLFSSVLSYLFTSSMMTALYNQAPLGLNHTAGSHRQSNG